MVTFRRAYWYLYRELSLSLSPFLVSPLPRRRSVSCRRRQRRGSKPKDSLERQRRHSIRDGGRIYSSSHREAARVESRALFPIVLAAGSRDFGPQERASEHRRTEQSGSETNRVYAAEKADYFIAWDSPRRGAPLLAFFERTN